ncbi:TetR/AcrR family transcriptional regulator [Parapedobacter sp. ISTM3]|uniref:TetR/AcrR family transcriptional regulator n=1 Tax=Parapedobacter sp. ISTM3 TaxID=2800130 RepID=UPI001907C800|nr:TetR/AcrR family transcriptional regulator [Parapedobacter sp. ISTM3]MBK1439847.1 TetR/AcrR family transcriptional regulator [Parapedobacter sp. ISTM3]
MHKLITAVGEVIQKQGYSGLNISNISKKAGVDRKLVYTYFGSLDNLIETYIRQKDYWNTKAKEVIERLSEDPQCIDADEMSSLLQGQFEAVIEDKSLQKFIHWEIGEKNEILRRLADSREETGERLLRHLDPYFNKKHVDLRAMLALQVGGLYYLALHAASNGSTFCGIDITQTQGKERIKKALDILIHDVFEKADLITDKH